MYGQVLVITAATLFCFFIIKRNTTINKIQCLGNDDSDAADPAFMDTWCCV